MRTAHECSPIERAVHVDQARGRGLTIGATAEAVQYLLRAGPADAENRSIPVHAAVPGRSAQQTVQLGQARNRAFPIGAAAEAVQYFLSTRSADTKKRFRNCQVVWPPLYVVPYSMPFA